MMRNTAILPALVLALSLAAAGPGSAQGAATVPGAGASSDDELFGSPEVTTEAAPQAAAPEKAFLKYDQVKVGGLLTGKLGYTGVWYDPWGSAPSLPDSRYLTPSLSSKLTITAKPATDFGVNLDFRMSYPFTTSTSVLTSATYAAGPAVETTSTTLSVNDIQVWAAYAKFSLGDRLFMSFGKQPIAWGVSKGFFQPADDIFAMSAVDYTDLAAEREGPLAFKAMYPIPLTMTSFYFYGGLPNSALNSLGNADLGELRLGAKAEINTGNTELALAGFYGFKDYPRLILMGTTGTGNFNFYGEAILKYGSERYFLSKTPAVAGAQESGNFYFSSTVGAYYTDSDRNITVMAQLYYNGEGQSGLNAEEAYTYYLSHPTEADRIKFAPLYAGLSFSKDKLFTDDLSVSCYAVADLSDLSAMIVPKATWAFSDYMNVALSATFTLGGTGGEYLINGPDMGYVSRYSTFTGVPVLKFDETPGLALSLIFTLGTGTF